ncbi:MAG: hypothetical protein FJY92_03990 [Candidatus Hydrogenedentes bacterium]|nr:hypothetical protein [Candidatus Hydrogenedentota bacterium]
MSASREANGKSKARNRNRIGPFRRRPRQRSAPSSTASAVDDQKLDWLELGIPAASGMAFEAARNKALAAGVPVMEVKDGAVYRVDASGSRALVKRIASARPVKLGTKIKLR